MENENDYEVEEEYCEYWEEPTYLDLENCTESFFN